MTMTITLELTQENLKKVEALLCEVPAAQVTETKTEPIKKEVETPAEKTSVTKADVKAKCVALSKAGKSDQLAGVFNQFGAKCFSEIAESDYAEVMKKLGEL